MRGSRSRGLAKWRVNAAFGGCPTAGSEAAHSQPAMGGREEGSEEGGRGTAAQWPVASRAVHTGHVFFLTEDGPLRAALRPKGRPLPMSRLHSNKTV